MRKKTELTFRGGLTRRVILACMIVVMTVQGEAQNNYSPIGLGGTLNASSGTYVIPIEVSPGSNGVQPSLSINSSMSGGNGLLGWGFSLQGLSSITPVPKNLYYDGQNSEVQYDSGDAFVLDGVRLIAIGNGEYRPSNDPYTKVVYSSGKFTVTAPDGTIAEYGGSVGNATFKTPQGKKAYAYALRKITDHNGNYMLYTYEVDNSEYRIKSIGYTGNGTYSPYNAVEFKYGSKSKPQSRYVAGECILCKSRITKIIINCEGDSTKNYTLTYNQNDRLIKVELTAEGINHTPTTIEWNTSIDLSCSRIQSFGSSLEIFVNDFDGDGDCDTLSVEEGLLNMEWSSTNTVFSINVYRSYVSLPPPQGSQGSGQAMITNVQLADIDGSGAQSVLLTIEAEQMSVIGEDTTFFNDVHLESFTVTPTGIQHKSLLATRFEQQNREAYCNTYPIDVNADGNVEIFAVVGGTLKLVSGANSFPATDSIREILPMNFDGDGNTDILLVREDGSMAVWEYEGNSFTVRKSYEAGTTLPGQDVWLGDFNGDGITDIFCKTTSSTWTIITGTGGAQGYTANGVMLALETTTTTKRCSIPLTSRVTIPDSIFHPSNNILIGDVDGDKMADIVYRTENTVEALCASERWETPVELITNVTQPMHGFVDAKADGVLDILLDDSFILLPTNSLCAGMVKKISNGLGEEIGFVYDCFHEAATIDNMQELPLRHVCGPFPYLKSVTRTCGSTFTETWQYTNCGGVEHINGLGFLGFKNTKVTNRTTGEKIESSNSFIVPPTTGTAKLYRSYKVDENRFKDKLCISSTKISYIKLEGSSPKVFSMRPERTLTTNHITGVASSTEYTYHQASGMVATESMTSTGWSSSTVMNYTAQGGLYRPTAVTTTTTHDGATYTHSTTYTYTAAYPLRIASCTQQGITTSFSSYDSYGNPKVITCGGRTLNKVYDNRGRFVTSTTDAAGLTTTYTYRNTDGLLTNTTSANQLITNLTLSTSAEKLSLRATYPDATTATVEIGTTEQYGAVLYRKEIAPTGGVKMEYLDAAGRIAAIDEYGVNGRVLTTQYTYNTQGQLSSINYPGIKTPTRYTYYEDGRVNTVKGHNGLNEEYSYLGLTTQHISRKNGTTTTTYDSRGNVVAVDAPTGMVTYTYYPSGKVKSMNAEGAITTYTYDNRGNEIETLEPDRGRRSYTYNIHNELLTQTDANGQITTLSYDAAGRLVGKSAQGYTENYTYGTTNETLGLLTAATRGEVELMFTYDNLCRPAATTTTIGTNTYTSTFTYNEQGLPDAVTYPTGVVVFNTYDSYGHLVSMGTSRNGTQLWTGLTSDAQGRWTSYALGNGLRTLLGYDATTQQLSSVKVGTQSYPTSLLHHAYTYDAKSYLKSRTDVKKNLTEEFLHDAAGRLTSATVVGQSAQTTGYSSNGNISSSTAGVYSYNITYKPHALTGITNGVQASRLPALTTNTTYSADNQLTSANNGTYGVTFTLYPGGARAKATYSRNGQLAGHKVYVDGCEILLDVQGLVTEQRTLINAPTGVVAVMVGGGAEADPTYVHTDNLGSWIALSNSNGRLVAQQAYDAWGRPRNPFTWSTYSPADAVDLAAVQPQFDRGYTGHEHLQGLGLIHMNGRAYDPYSQRFLSPDPVLQLPTNAQNHNRYSYCLNSPLKFTDPSGYSLSMLESLGKREHEGFFYDYTINDHMGWLHSGGGGGGNNCNYFMGPGYTNWVEGGTQEDQEDQEPQGVTIIDEATITYVLLNPGSISKLRELANDGVNYVEFFEDGDTFWGTNWIEPVPIIRKINQWNDEGEGGWLTATDHTNNGIGGFGTGMSYLGGNFRINNSSGFSPKLYTKPNAAGKIFNGGFGIKTYNTTNWGRGIGYGSLGVSFVIGGINVTNAWQQDGHTYGANTQMALAQSSLGISGAWAGAEIGAAIGVWFGGFGAIPGAIIGGMIGGWGGSKLGETVVNNFSSY